MMTLTDLINLEYSPSPLTRLHHLLNKSDPTLFLTVASDELKLFAAIFRGALRERVYRIVKNLKEPDDPEHTPQAIGSFCSEISQVCYKFRQLQDISHSRSDYPQLIRHFKYIDEFISTAIEEFLVILLKQYRSLEEYDRTADKIVTQLVIKGKIIS